MKEISKATFAKTVKKLREENGFTQEEMADLLGISQPAYAQYEKQKTMPSLSNFLKIANFFDISVSALSGDGGGAE